MMQLFLRTGICFGGEESRVKKLRLPKKWKLAFLSVAALILVLLGIRYFNLYRLHLEERTRFMMDTYVTIYAVGPKKITIPAITSALDRMQEIDRKFNSQNVESPIYAFNHRGIPVSDPEVVAMVRLALQIASDTGGAFDITIAPLIELWGFYGDSPHLPKQEAIKDCLSRVGYQHLAIKKGTLQKDKVDVQIDLGAIAKGYGVLQAAAVLKKKGVSSALINAGGDVYAMGKKGRDMWKVGLRSPRGDDILGYLEVEDLAVMGSGDYERFFIEDGKRYHHIFDPKTGYPAEGLSATTLVHPDPMVADAWNTAIFVLGPDNGLKWVEKISGMEAVMVTTAGDIIYSSGLKNALHVIEAE
jgi:thiamine biosynthesis lipoprotein